MKLPPVFTLSFVLLFATIIPTSLANTEKVIFQQAPPTEILTEVQPWLGANPRTLTPSDPVLRASLPVAFPKLEQPQGLASWYRLADLAVNQRYEVRVCWAATVRCTISL